MKVALIQLPVVEDKLTNINKAKEMLIEAKNNGCDIAVLPEIFCCPYRADSFISCGEEKGGMAYTMLKNTSKELGIYIIGGSIPEKEDGKIYNASFVFDREGNEIAHHRKIHMFDIDIPGGQKFKESDNFSSGNSITTFDTEFGLMGLCICFDMRFEELARVMCLRGAKAIFVPAAFNMTTGPAHWEVLFRQRAIDNQCFTFGCAPARDINASYVSYGNSIAVEPFGEVIARADEKTTILYCDIDLKRVDNVRMQLPILSSRRLDLYSVDEK